MKARNRVLVFGIIVILANVVAATIAVAVNWPAQFGRVGTDARAEVFASGTAISAPLLPIAILAVSLLLIRAGGRWISVGLLAFSVVALLMVIGGLGEAFAPETPDTPKMVLIVSGIVSVVVAVVMLALAFAAFHERRRAIRSAHEQ